MLMLWMVLEFSIGYNGRNWYDQNPKLYAEFAGKAGQVLWNGKIPM
jgi:hypothetical protein